MKNMNHKIEKLLHEGFSMKTLDTFTSNQIDVLYERIKKETKEATTKTVTSTTYSPDEAKGKSFQGTTTVKPDGSVEVTKEGEVTERSKSKKQQQFFGIVRGMQKGDIPKKGSAGKAAKEMSAKDVKDFASTKHKGLPDEVKEDKKFIQKATKKMESKGTEGKFGSWCKKQGLDSDGEVTKKCINAGLKSDDSSVVKMANFAKNIGGFKGSEHKKKSETKENVKNLEESIMKLIENHLPPTTTKGELLNSIKRFKR
jgi:hypothetical protein